MTKFFDTNALLELREDLLKEDFFLISNISLFELEHIKTSGTKDEETKWAARKVLHILAENSNKYQSIIYSLDLDKEIEKYNLPKTPDSQIIVTVIDACKANKDIVFITADLACKQIADSLGLKTQYPKIIDDDYNGFIEVEFEDQQLANFYNDILVNNINYYNLFINQYLIIKFNNEIIDKYCWTEEGYRKINFQKVESIHFGKITSKDVYQQIALDSLKNNQITMLKGPAGTGKSYLAFGYMFDLLEHDKIDKIIVFCNTVATKGSARLGFYPGTRTEKLLDSQIGNLLESKLGDRVEVEKLIDEHQLILLPLSDIRGFDTTGMNAAVYISEAQNLDIELMRLALQRIGEDSLCILDGDFSHQVDMSIYAGSNNGMRRVSEVFRGQPYYGEVTLQTIYRSKIALQAELM
mgnify:CR=1 FL=1